MHEDYLEIKHAQQVNTFILINKEKHPNKYYYVFNVTLVILILL